jgi:hypothetical protein
MMFRKALAASLVLVVVGAGIAWASAPSIRHAGHCDGTSTSALVVTQYSATSLRVRFAVNNATPGQTWQLFGSDNGHRIFALNRLASPTGTAAVTRYPADQPGSDVIKATGLNSVTGETCSASLTFPAS